MFEKTFRITPNPTGEEDKKNDIVISYIKKKFIENPRVRKFLLAKEYTKSEGLHYHGYIKTDYHLQSIRKLIQNMCKIRYKGNGFCSIKGEDIGEYWKNYICKDGDIKYHKGFTKKDIKKAIKEGQQYKEIKKIIEMKWKERVWYYLDKKGLKDKIINKYVTNYALNIDKNLLPVVLQISSECNINPPPPTTYQSIRMGVIRTLFPKAFKKWYIQYIQESMKYKGPMCIYNPDYDQPDLSSDSEFEDLLEKSIENNKKYKQLIPKTI